MKDSNINASHYQYVSAHRKQIYSSLLDCVADLFKKQFITTQLLTTSTFTHLQFFLNSGFMLKRSMGQRRKFPAHLQNLVSALHTSIDKLAQKISSAKQLND